MPRSTNHCTLIIISIIYQNFQNTIFWYKDMEEKIDENVAWSVNQGIISAIQSGLTLIRYNAQILLWLILLKMRPMRQKFSEIWYHWISTFKLINKSTNKNIPTRPPYNKFYHHLELFPLLVNSFTILNSSGKLAIFILATLVFLHCNI